jgi:HAD superfamily hydrolase (TIGR01490 family)
VYTVSGVPALAPRSLAVFDLDGTITRFDTLGPYLTRCLARRPWRALRLALVLPALARYCIDRDRGALKGAVLHAALGGLSRRWLATRTARFVAWLQRRGLFREALAAIQVHRDRGDALVLMSASVDLYVPQVGQALGFGQTICSTVLWRADGRLEGHLQGPNCRGEEKRRRLETLVERERPSRLYAYGNSASDVPHLLLAQEGFLVNGPRRLEAASLHRLHWSQRAKQNVSESTGG